MDENVRYGNTGGGSPSRAPVDATGKVIGKDEKTVTLAPCHCTIDKEAQTRLYANILSASCSNQQIVFEQTVATVRRESSTT